MTERNNLFPIFLKLDELQTLVVGGGEVALEKINALLKSSPAASVTVVAPIILEEIKQQAMSNPRIRLINRVFRLRDLKWADVLILATDDHELHKKIRVQAKKRRLLVNVADTPELCDFYLGSVVTKGSVKIGISTNGKSPTMAKRLREFFEESLPDDAEELLSNMNNIRSRIKGSLQEKIRTLNRVTSSWLQGTSFDK